MYRFTPIKKYIVLFLICILCTPVTSNAYSVLTHEAIVDALWAKSIEPLLKQKYPGLTEAQLNEAHSYAYGGAISPDMGYFPFGSHLFTNLVHYVRSGDFVNALLEEAKDVNEYAYALGFLCHYMSDRYGHNIGTNQCVPIVYPKMLEKFGNRVTFEEDPVSHKRIEFSFDVLQTAKGNYASQAYHSFIGFHVARPVLERAFVKTYGLDINDVFKNLSVAIETFRFSVTSLFPILTKSAWVIKKADILKETPTATSRNFRYKMNRANYYQDSGSKTKRPGFFAFTLSWLVRVLPKIGPLRSLKIRTPGPEAEKLFMQSFDTVLLNCTASMKLLRYGNIKLTNVDFDTGNPTLAGEYKLADDNYGTLIVKLNDKDFTEVSPALRLNIIQFYSQPTRQPITHKDRKKWEKVQNAIAELKGEKESI
jgi:hypothetical protein